MTLKLELSHAPSPARGRPTRTRRSWSSCRHITARRRAASSTSWCTPRSHHDRGAGHRDAQAPRAAQREQAERGAGRAPGRGERPRVAPGPARPTERPPEAVRRARGGARGPGGAEGARRLRHPQAGEARDAVPVGAFGRVPGRRGVPRKGGCDVNEVYLSTRSTGRSTRSATGCSRGRRIGAGPAQARQPLRRRRDRRLNLDSSAGSRRKGSPACTSAGRGSSRASSS